MTAPLTTTRDTIKNIAAIRRIKNTRATAHKHHTLYAGYLILIIALGAGYPLVVSISYLLASPVFTTMLEKQASLKNLSACLTITLILCLFAGRIRGPALPKPFDTFVLTQAWMPYAVVFLPAFLTSTITIMVSYAAFSCIFLFSAFPAHMPPSGTMIVLSALGACCFAAISNIARLAGQTLNNKQRHAICSVLIILSVLPYVHSVFLTIAPGAWYASLLPLPHDAHLPPQPAFTLLVILTIALLPTIPFMLNKLNSGQLLQQSVRWSLITAFGSVGNLPEAFTLLRAHQPPTFLARRWKTVTGGPLTFTFLQQGLTGSIRKPVRLTISLLTIFAIAHILFTLENTTKNTPSNINNDWLAYCALSLTLYAAVGALCDGIRHTSINHRSPTSLYGTNTYHLLLLHAQTPLCCSIIVATAALATTGTPLISTPAFTIFITLICIILLHAADAFKPPAPPALLTMPLPTMIGDLSALTLLAWNLEAPLTNTAITLLLHQTPPGPLWTPLILTALTLLLTRRTRQGKACAVIVL